MGIGQTHPHRQLGVALLHAAGTHADHGVVQPRRQIAGGEAGRRRWILPGGEHQLRLCRRDAGPGVGHLIQLREQQPQLVGEHPQGVEIGPHHADGDGGIERRALLERQGQHLGIGQRCREPAL